MDHWDSRKRAHDEDDDDDDQSECWKRSRVQSTDSPIGGRSGTASPSRNWSTLSFLNTGAAASWMNTDVIGEVKNQIAQDRDSTNVKHSPSHSSTSSASSFGISDLNRVGMSSFLNTSSNVKQSPSHSATLGVSDVSRKGMSSFLNSSALPWGQSDMFQQLKQQWNLNPFSSQQTNKQTADSDDMEICSSNSDSPTPIGPPLPHDSPPPLPPPPSPLPPPPSFSSFPALANVSKEYIKPNSRSLHFPGQSSSKSSQLTLLPNLPLSRLLEELAHKDSSLSPPSHSSHQFVEHEIEPQLAELPVDNNSVLSPPLCSSHQSGEFAAGSVQSPCQSSADDQPELHCGEHVDDKEISPSPTFSAQDDRKSPTLFPQADEYDTNSVLSHSSTLDEQFPELATGNDTAFSPEPTLSHELLEGDNIFELVILSSDKDSELSSPLASFTPLPHQLPNVSVNSSPLTSTTPPHEFPKISEDNSPLESTTPLPHRSPKVSKNSSPLTSTTPPHELPKISENNSPLESITLLHKSPNISEDDFPLAITTPPLPNQSPKISEDNSQSSITTSPLPCQTSKMPEDNFPLAITTPPVPDPAPKISEYNSSLPITTPPLPHPPIKISEEDDVDSQSTPSIPHESPESEENPMSTSNSPPKSTEGKCVSKLDSDFRDQSPVPKLSASPDKINSEDPTSSTPNDDVRNEKQDENKEVSLLQENIDVQANQNIDEETNLDGDKKEEETETERSSLVLKTIKRINELQAIPSHSYKDGCNFMKAFPPRPADAEKIISNVPNYWITAKDPSTFLSSYVTVGLPIGSEEYQYVQNKFMGILPCSILAIDRVENPYSLFNYELRKEELLKYGVDFMEFHLFHGTSIDNLKSIVETNFDWKRYGTNVGSKFGQGVSFTPNASYAVHYTDKSLDLNVIILTRVLVSKFCLGDVSNILPPVGYDTTISPTGKVWVKYNNDEFYPDYIVYFKLNDMSWFEKAEILMHPSEAIRFYQSDDDPFRSHPFIHPDERVSPNINFHPQEDFTSDNFRFSPTFDPYRRKTPENPPENRDLSSSQQTSVRGSKARRRSHRPVRNLRGRDLPRGRGRDLPRHSVENPEFIPENNRHPESLRLSPQEPLLTRTIHLHQGANNPFIFNRHVVMPNVSPPDQFQFNRPDIGRRPDEPFIFHGNAQGSGIPHLSPPNQFQFIRPEIGRHIDAPFIFLGNQGPGIPHLSPQDPFIRPEIVRHTDEPLIFRQVVGTPHLSPPEQLQFNRPGFSGGLVRHPNDPFIFHGNNQGPEMSRFSPSDQFQINRPFDGGFLRHPENQGGPFHFPGNNF